MRARLTALCAAALVVVAAGCANDPTAGLGPKEIGSSPSSSAPSYDATAHSQGLIGNLLNTVTSVLSPPKYYVCQNNGGPYTGSATIGAQGGVIKFGPNTFTVPAGALSRSVTISASTVAGDTIAAVMQPSGLTFAKPATLSFDLSHCGGSRSADSTLTVVYVSNDLLNLLNIIPTLLNDVLGHNSLLGSITHFSVYAVAERR